jgi:hypothetical protein
MTKLMALGALTAGVMMAGTRAEAASLPGQNGLRPALDSLALIETVQASRFFHRGHWYCYYLDGIFGEGWYRCGFHRTRNRLYWGGGRGWNNWWYSGWGQRPAGWRGGGPTIIINPMGKGGGGDGGGSGPMMGGKSGGSGGGGPGPMGKSKMGGS